MCERKALALAADLLMFLNDPLPGLSLYQNSESWSCHNAPTYMKEAVDMMLNRDSVRDLGWKELVRGKINNQRRNRHFNTKIFNDEISERLGDMTAEWQETVASEWEESEEKWKDRLGNDLGRIDARALERKAADAEFIRESERFFVSVPAQHLATEPADAMSGVQTGISINMNAAGG